jgi:hypothetical protein
MDNVKFEVEFKGTEFKGEWQHFKWDLKINGHSFEYRTGLGHLKTNKTRKGTPLSDLVRLDNLTQGQKIELTKKPYAMQYVYELDGITDIYAVKPKLEDVLESLLLDASCSNESFEDFCSNCGYDTDSRRALDNYLKCQENGVKLRKALGAQYSEVQKTIEERNS